MPKNVSASVAPNVIRGRYTAFEPSENSPFIWAGREDCAADYHLSRSTFSYQATELIVSGQWLLTQENHSYSLYPGAVFNYGPQYGYELKATGKGPWIKYFIDLSGNTMEHHLGPHGFFQNKPLLISDPRWIADIFDQILHLNEHSDDSRSQLLPPLLELLLLRLSSDLVTDQTPHTRSRQTFQKCKHYMQEHYLTISDVTTAAQACRVDPAHFSRLFVRYEGTAPFKYLTQLKINHAYKLLLRNHLTVKEAAHAVGYDDPYHFSRVFKKVQGRSPSHYN